MLQHELSTPQRQAPLGVIIMFLMNLRKWANVLVFGLLPFIREREESLPFWIFWVFAGVVLAIIILFSFLQWKNYFFSIEDGKFIIRQGVLRKEETSIDLERIQSVHIKRNIVQQILDLAGLQLDTAGSSKKEAKIPALKYAFAEELKKELISLKTETVSSSALEGDEQEENANSSEQVIMKLSLIDLFKVGLTENHLQSGLILLGVFFGTTSQLSELFGYEEQNIYEQVFRFLLIVLPVFIILFMIISVLWSMLRIFLRYFDLTVTLKKSGLSIKAGLLKREENFVPVNKIQFIKWKSNPLRKWIGYKSLSIYQASSQEVQKKKTVKVPGCRMEQREAVEQTFYPELNSNAKYASFKPHAFWKYRLMLFFVLIPAGFSVFFYYKSDYEFMAAAAIVSLLAIFFVHKYVQKFSAHISEKLLLIYHGYVFPQETMLKLYKVQNIAVKQSIFQKRRGLLTIRIYTASGSLNIPFIPENQGLAIANKLLFEVEKSKKSWM